MKVSLNLQQEDLSNSNPFIKAKLPISIFNQPFTSILTTHTHSLSHLSAALSTNFSSGPSLKFTFSPFSLSLKSGLGLFGSPRDSPLVFSAQFSLSNSTPNSILSTFSLNFKPQIGHFSLHKSSSSNPNFESQSVSGLQIDSTTSSDSESGNGKLGWQEVKLEPFIGKEKEDNNLSSDVGVEYLPNRQLVWLGRKKSGFVSGVSVKARTELPLSKRVKVNLRWVLNLPDNLGTKMPSLTVNKIGLERVVEEAVKELKEKSNNEKPAAAADLELIKGMCFWMTRDLEIIEKENRDLKQCLEEMRHGVSSSAYSSSIATDDKFFEIEERRNKKNDAVNTKTTELKKKPTVTKPVFDFESELQKAIKAAAAAS